MKTKNYVFHKALGLSQFVVCQVKVSIADSTSEESSYREHPMIQVNVFKVNSLTSKAEALQVYRIFADTPTTFMEEKCPHKRVLLRSYIAALENYLSLSFNLLSHTYDNYHVRLITDHIRSEERRVQKFSANKKIWDLLQFYSEHSVDHKKDRIQAYRLHEGKNLEMNYTRNHIEI